MTSPVIHQRESCENDGLQNEIDKLCDQMGVIQSELELEKVQNAQMKEVR